MTVTSDAGSHLELDDQIDRQFQFLLACFWSARSWRIHMVVSNVVMGATAMNATRRAACGEILVAGFREVRDEE